MDEISRDNRLLDTRYSVTRCYSSYHGWDISATRNIPRHVIVRATILFDTFIPTKEIFYAILFAISFLRDIFLDNVEARVVEPAPPHLSFHFHLPIYHYIYIYITFTKKTRASTNQDPINSSSIIKDPLKDREFFVIDRYQIQRLLLPRFLALL